VPRSPPPPSFGSSALSSPRFASSSHFGIGQAFFYSIDPPVPAVPANLPIRCAPCMCILACIRCEGWTRLDYLDTRRPKGRREEESNVLQCNGKQHRTPRGLALGSISRRSPARTPAAKRFGESSAERSGIPAESRKAMTRRDRARAREDERADRISNSAHLSPRLRFLAVESSAEYYNSVGAKREKARKGDRGFPSRARARARDALHPRKPRRQHVHARRRA